MAKSLAVFRFRGHHVEVTPYRLAEPPLFTRLRDATRVLIAGAGGGFDVYGGLPLAVALQAQGKTVHLANLSFSNLRRLALHDWFAPGVAAIGPESAGNDDYFPERSLARWLASTGRDPLVYAFPKSGVRPLRAAYAALVERLGIDTIVLVDGGTDILLRGDEAGLGTPQEDMTSLAAVAGLPDINRLVVSVGFGVDAYHGVCHAHVLENLAALQKQHAYLGALSIPAESPEGTAYFAAVVHALAETPLRPSIVHSQIASALRGEFGDVHATDRTSGTELFVNPLMAMYLSVDLPALARTVEYLPHLEPTEHAYQVAQLIEAHLTSRPEPRPAGFIPH
ncbi:DUF1152 domain-containing protein [Nocardia yamanashiensis]|uniref:DUF1152 domain-containing protein n=1 Tax=Nocardia yamanashiensis TaxID=209247 RepID=UPI001E548433|nr:DUF1152 domain-containing protein [Nocardia yamanashiensis]UGT43541.1 DUF1152 domain-containing protein [Nocardia yamanashiensis]